MAAIAALTVSYPLGELPERREAEPAQADVVVAVLRPGVLTATDRQCDPARRDAGLYPAPSSLG